MKSATRIVLATVGTATAVGWLIGGKALTQPDVSTATATETRQADTPLVETPTPTSSASGATESGDAGSSETGAGDAGSSDTGAGDTGSGSSSTAAATYTGAAAQTRYGDVQVAITVEGSTITDIEVVDYPNADHHDQEINAAAIPILVREGLAAQSAQVATVSGATYTSQGYQRSLQSAIDQAGL